MTVKQDGGKIYTLPEIQTRNLISILHITLKGLFSEATHSDSKDLVKFSWFPTEHCRDDTLKLFNRSSLFITKSFNVISFQFAVSKYKQ
jgi:hypothetical protein